MTKLVRAVRPTIAVLAARRIGGWLRHRRRVLADGPPDAGMSTAEYAIGTVVILRRKWV